MTKIKSNNNLNNNNNNITKSKIKCNILSSCTIITKDDKYLHYVIEDDISLEELNAYFTNQYKKILIELFLVKLLDIYIKNMFKTK